LKRRVLFIFLDGVGLGEDDAAHNPFTTAEMPALRGLLGGQRMLRDTPAGDYGRALFIPTDARLGMDGPPQSATGQAAIVTGRNVPREIGGHWGPKPNAHVATIIRQGTTFSRLTEAGKRAALLNAYPQRYFDAVASGRRSYSAIPLAVTAAGLRLFTTDDLRAARAMSADFTAEGWPEAGALKLTPRAAGHRLADVAAQHDFAFFEHWITDYVGHRGDLDEAREVLARFDGVLGGLLEAWDDSTGLIVITSDHGNMEALDHSHHTLNPVPTIVVGEARWAFEGVTDLTGLAGAVEGYLAGEG
jgi:2,3-bisphosphoglycerate-independent phosphoglycerate mutase